MFDTLFGAEMPLAVRFFLAFLIVLGLIGVTAWVVRRFGAGRLGSGTARGRQPRLAVIDYASVDGRRRLILVRRDNVEHLLMIGGPSDIVVEPNIVRAVASPRDAARPPVGIEALPRAIPLPDAGNGPGNNPGAGWPLQPEPTAGARPAPRFEPLPDEAPRPEPPRPELPRHELPRPLSSLAEPPARPQRDTLAALADELSSRPPLPPRRPALGRPAPEAQGEEEPVTQPEAESQAEAPRPDISRPEPRKPAPSMGASMSASIAAPIPAPPPTPAPPIAPAAEAGTAPDQSLADMAQRLEAALRKPLAESRPQAAALRPADAERAEPTPPPMPPRMPRPALPKGRPEAKPAQPTPPASGKTTVYDSLEQEMASLLGRPTKT
ncbi:MAG TPA: flagellar biosynthetic protein FliO [Xanthobacteraceae bacterium]|jgi:flagellar protein FliO/FliZ|nr:flagellar biosynthetic protein FliO [Xanthobacteraceae bacterium]